MSFGEAMRDRKSPGSGSVGELMKREPSLAESYLILRIDQDPRDYLRGRVERRY
jgi:hypothetical protein